MENLSMHLKMGRMQACCFAPLLAVSRSVNRARKSKQADFALLKALHESYTPPHVHAVNKPPDGVKNRRIWP
jgi:hypothetical protein